MPAPHAFAARFQDYLRDAQRARAQSQHHDQRRELFLTFVGGVFGIQQADIQREYFLRIDRGRQGWIDALFRDVVFEFKRDLKRERSDGLRELGDYLRTLTHGADCVGLLTDGLQFEVYRLDDDRALCAEPFDSIDLERADAERVFLWLDSYLFSQKATPPTSADIVQRFGAQSPTFQIAAGTLHRLLKRVEKSPAVLTKQAQWRGVLAKVYGSDVGGDDLFVRHTFLNQFAKLLAYAALFDSLPRDEDTLARIVSGEAFHNQGVGNLGEIDFFAWVLDDEGARGEVIAMLRGLADSLGVYDLKQIDEDLLKQLYQNLVDPATRHDLGEFYTPDWLAELTLDEIDYHAGQSLLDPSCGSGTFLFMAIRRLAAGGLTGWALVDFALENIAGLDVHPLAVTVARVNYVLAISPHMHGARKRKGGGVLAIPVYMADALQTPEVTGKHKDTLIVSVDHGRDEKFHIPAEAASAPADFSAVIDLMHEYAQRPAAEMNSLRSAFVANARERFGAVQRGTGEMSGSYWGGNLALLNRLIHEGRDSIWAYMLKNTARPLLLSEQKFDVIAGNPPWLTYNYIKDRTYQREVKELYQCYRLIESRDVNQSANMDLSTLFMAHCEATYLKAGG